MLTLKRLWCRFTHPRTPRKGTLYGFVYHCLYCERCGFWFVGKRLDR